MAELFIQNKTTVIKLIIKAENCPLYCFVEPF